MPKVLRLNTGKTNCTQFTELIRLADDDQIEEISHIALLRQDIQDLVAMHLLTDEDFLELGLTIPWEVFTFCVKMYREGKFPKILQAEMKGGQFFRYIQVDAIDTETEMTYVGHYL